MFNFLNATVLLASVAALIPLIIHLFSKRKVKIIEFSSLKHLKAMQRRQVRRLKIRQLLLLLLRMLIILAVVLAFARPTTKGGNIGSHASVSAVILFDNSASMNRYVTDGNLFDIAKKKTKELLKTFSASDKICFIPLTKSYEQAKSSLFFTSPAVALEKLNRLTCQYGVADLEGSLGNAVDLLKKAVNVNKEIYLITDRQQNILPDTLPDTAILKDVPAHIYLVDLPLEKIDNIGITSVDFGGQLIMPGHDFNITAHIKNYGTDERNDLIASLFIDGNRIAQTNFKILADKETAVKFTRSVSNTGFHSGYIEISDDKFIGDNRYYFSFKIPEHFNLLIINGDQTGEIMKLALAPSASLNQYWSVKIASPQNLAGINFWDYNVIILAGVPQLDDTYIQRLKTFLSRGKALFLTYDGKTDIKYFNKIWSPVTDVVYDQGIDNNFTRAGYYSLLSLNVNHPIFSVFDLTKKKMPEIKFFTLPKFHLKNNPQVLMRFTGDHPALVETTFGNGKVLTFTGPLAPYYSDITSHAFFVPFISRIAEYLASDLSKYDLHLYCGENITRSLSLKKSINNILVLITPDSSRFDLTPEDEQGSLVINVKPTNLPGIYHIMDKNHEIDRLAVNINPEECNLKAIDIDQLTTALGASKINTIGNNVPMASIINQYRYGKELWQIFLWIAVILLAMEMLLSHSRPNKKE
ncbi:MAG: VWA domain-containing protein [FCB group bacterium]|nr:VWA domain-containing protein [FCB group bacterium]